MKAAVIASLVAVLSAAAGATAGSLVTSAQIKDHTIQKRDLAPSLARALNRRARQGVQGIQGEPGPAGPQGPRGEQGPPGFQSIITALGNFVSIPPGQYRTSIATCPAGSKLTGGGWNANDSVLVTRNALLSFGWEVRALNLDDTFSAFLTAYARCAS